jgi:uncharacterized membrane protein
MMATPTRYRIESIDLLRGLVMVLMALDHAREFFGYGTFFRDPTDLKTTTACLFATRWVTHFCAPVFVFLAGTGARLYGSRRDSRRSAARYLLTRGLWLILLEFTVVNLAWSFNITFSIQIFQVIWVIGFSMVCLSALVYLPECALLVLGLILVAGHNLLDFITSDAVTSHWIWYALHEQNVLITGPDSGILFVYPVLPWIGVMILGYVFGGLYVKGFDAARRKKLLLWMGGGAVGLFALLRLINIYGDPAPWGLQKNFLFSLMSFVNTTKYPPSLLFLLMTLGPSLLFLWATENIQNRLTKPLVVLGRVPLFFYIIHLYFIHLLAIPAVMLAGRPWQDIILTVQGFVTMRLADYGYGLGVVYVIWIIAVVSLYPVCKWYYNYKAHHRDRWWLSYL